MSNNCKEKVMNHFKLVLLLSLLLLASCAKEDCIDLLLATSSLESEYGCVNTKYQMSIDLNNTYTIIRNQSDFDEKVSGSCTVNIDFKKYDLVIGKHGLSNGNAKIEYEFNQICDVYVPQLSVVFFQDLTDVAPNLTYHVLVGKLPDGGEVPVTIIEKF